MNEFNINLKLKEFTDDEEFSLAIESLRDAVIGEHLKNALNYNEIESSVISEILKYFHFNYNEQPLPTSINTLEKQLEYRLHPFGIMYRTVHLDTKWYKKSTLIMIGTMKESGNAVILKPGKLGGYLLIDPLTSKKSRINKKIASILDEEAICFYPPLPSKSLTIKDLLQFMFNQLNVSDILFYVGVIFALSLLGLFAPMFTKLLFGTVLVTNNVQQLIALSILITSYLVSSLCLKIYQNLMKSKMSTKQDVIVQAALINRVIHLPSSFFTGFSSGELYYKIQSAETICSTIFETIGSTGLTSLFSIIYIGQISHYAKSLVLPSILIILTSFLFTIITSIVESKHLLKQMDASAKTSGLTYATVKGIQKIKLTGSETRMFAKWAKTYAKEASLQYNPPLFLKLSNVFQLTITLIGTIVLYAISIQNHISVDNYYAFSSAYGMIAAAFNTLANACLLSSTIPPMLEMAKPILEAIPENSENKEIVTDLSGAIEINHLSFRYDHDLPNVIDDLSLSIKPGEYVAITGATGCGKSTLLRLLLGFETPQKGSVFYDRHDLQDIDLPTLRKQIGTVQQNSKLFPSDILSNITISAPLLSEEDAWNAAELASIADDIKQMPMGMHTIISEGQGGISGGQKQRILIARALAPKPKILFFDEATSALDNITQNKISNAIDSLNCTRVVIAHRLSTIKNADRILYLENGKIAEQGTYDELINLNGKFAHLVERQRLD